MMAPCGSHDYKTHDSRRIIRLVAEEESGFYTWFFKPLFLSDEYPLINQGGEQKPQSLFITTFDWIFFYIFPRFFGSTTQMLNSKFKNTRFPPTGWGKISMPFRHGYPKTISIPPKLWAWPFFPVLIIRNNPWDSHPESSKAIRYVWWNRLTNPERLWVSAEFWRKHQ